MRFLLSSFCLIITQTLCAQTAVYNQTDAKGKPHGQWIIRQEARMGEEAFSEWGTFEHGVKWGAWYKFDRDAEVIAIERFRNGALDGEATYFERGSLVCIGHYRGLNPAYAFDTIYVLDPVRDVEIRKVISTERGTVKHGLWRYYDPRTGRMYRELDYQLDEVIAKQDFSVAATDSAWYRQREKAFLQKQKHPFKPTQERRIRYTDFR